MSSLTCQKPLDFLSSEQKNKLNEHFRKSTTAMPHQLAVLLGIKYAEALTILTILDADGLCKNKLLIYHQCEPETPADAIPYGQGFPNLPWTCPLCEEEVDNYDELLFDIMAQADHPINFE
jgi:hypothetical protein